MTTKAEEKIEKLFDKKYSEISQKSIQNVAGIFLWGFMCGVVLSYTNILYISAGFCFGYFVAKKQENSFIDMSVVSIAKSQEISMWDIINKFYPTKTE